MDFHKVTEKRFLPYLRITGSILAILALTSCEWLGISNPFSDNQRPKQVVEGPRHEPILNPDTVPPEPAVSGYIHGTEPPQVQPIREGISPQYYNNLPPSPGNNTPSSGNNAPSPPSANTPTMPPSSGNSGASDQGFGTGLLSPGQSDNEGSAEEYYDSIPATPSNQESQGGFFSRLFGSGSGDEARKRLPGNPAPEPQVSQPDISAPVPDASKAPWQQRSELPSDSATQIADASPVQDQDDSQSDDNGTQQDADASPAKPSWLGRLFGKYSGNEQDPARNEPTPALSSVPPTPTQFQAVKNEQLQDMQDLQGERLAADQEKQDLDSEPLQQHPAVPAGGSSDSGTSNQAASQPANPSAPVLLGHADASTVATGNVTGDAATHPLQLPTSYDLPPPAQAHNPSESDDYVSALQHAETPQAAAPAQVVPASDSATSSAPAQAQPASAASNQAPQQQATQ